MAFPCAFSSCAIELLSLFALRSSAGIALPWTPHALNNIHSFTVKTSLWSRHSYSIPAAELPAASADQFYRDSKSHGKSSPRVTCFYVGNGSWLHRTHWACYQRNVDHDPEPGSAAPWQYIDHRHNPHISPKYAYRPQAYLDPRSDGSGALAWPGNNHTDLDGFFRHIINKQNGIKLDDMVGKANQDTLIKAVQDTYAQYMSLVIDMKFRQNMTAEESLASLANGTILSYRSRLKKAYDSKLTLQILLGVMALLGGTAVLWTDLRGTLPRKPTSIARTMAFLAGSELCSGQNSLLPKNVMWMKDKDLANVVDGSLFSLGWWSRQVVQVETLSQEDSRDGDGDDADNVADERAAEGGKVERWFGIDVGMPEQLGFRARRDWRPEWLKDKNWLKWSRVKVDLFQASFMLPFDIRSSDSISIDQQGADDPDHEKQSQCSAWSRLRLGPS